MSDLTKFYHEAVAFFEGLAGKYPQAAPAINAAAASLGQAATDVEAAGAAVLPGLANQGVNFVLGLVPGGSSLDGFVDALIDEVIAGLTAKKSAAA